MHQEKFSIAALVSTGWSPKENDPLIEYTHNRPKALIPIAGKPMVAHVVDALAHSQYVDYVSVISLSPDDGVQFSTDVEYVPDAGGILANAEAGMDHVVAHHPDVDAILLCTSDIPTITASIIDAFIEECMRTDHDLYYSIVERSVMEARFPNSRRTYVHLREGDFAGGDVFLARPSLVLEDRSLWLGLTEARKNALKQVRMVGFWPFLKFITRRLSIEEAEQRASKALNIEAKAVTFSHAEVGMDVDKPFQLEIVRAELETRSALAD